MAFSLIYTKAQYEAKITELEGYHKMLEQHLTRMKELKEGMSQFWEDENARTTGQILQLEIESVQRTMDRTTENIIFLRSTVDKLGGSNAAVNELLQEALTILGAVI